MKNFFVDLEYFLHRYNHILKDGTPSKERCKEQIENMMKAYLLSNKVK